MFFISLPCFVLRFGLSLFNLPDRDNIVSVPSGSNVVSNFPLTSSSKSVSLGNRISRIEETLGIFQFVLWKVNPDKAISVILALCRENLNCAVTEADFTIVERLHRKYARVLIAASSLALKQRILACLYLDSLTFVFISLNSY